MLYIVLSATCKYRLGKYDQLKFRSKPQNGFSCNHISIIKNSNYQNYWINNDNKNQKVTTQLTCIEM